MQSQVIETDTAQLTVERMDDHLYYVKFNKPASYQLNHFFWSNKTIFALLSILHKFVGKTTD